MYVHSQIYVCLSALKTLNEVSVLVCHNICLWFWKPHNGHIHMCSFIFPHKLLNKQTFQFFTGRIFQLSISIYATLINFPTQLPSFNNQSLTVSLCNFDSRLIESKQHMQIFLQCLCLSQPPGEVVGSSVGRRLTRKVQVIGFVYVHSQIYICLSALKTLSEVSVLACHYASNSGNPIMGIFLCVVLFSLTNCQTNKLFNFSLEESSSYRFLYMLRSFTFLHSYLLLITNHLPCPYATTHAHIPSMAMVIAAAGWGGWQLCVAGVGAQPPAGGSPAAASRHLRPPGGPGVPLLVENIDLCLWNSWKCTWRLTLLLFNMLFVTLKFICYNIYYKD